MRVAREVIEDLLPVYLSGEASAATRALVEEALRADPDLAARVRRAMAESLPASQAALPSGLEVRAFRKARRLLTVQRWLMGLAMATTALLASSQFTIVDGRVTEWHFLARDYPTASAVLISLALSLWVAYAVVRTKNRAPA